MPIIRIIPPPVPVQAPHHWRLSETARTRGSGPVPSQSSALRITGLGKKPPLSATITPQVSAVHRGSPRHRPSFPIDGPRGFVLPRFVNLDRHPSAVGVALRSTSRNFQVSGHSLGATSSSTSTPQKRPCGGWGGTAIHPISGIFALSRQTPIFLSCHAHGPSEQQ